MFCQTAHLANLVHAVLAKCPSFSKSRNCFVQHSRQSQSARTKVTQQFKDCAVGVLVATDVVARGMDFPLVSHVFQLGVDCVETYVHRVGRTGRNGAEGTGFLILAPQESYLVPLLRKMNIPIKTESIQIDVKPFIVQAIVGFCSDSENAKKVYQSWLGSIDLIIGYYNSQRGMKLDKPTLIHLAQNFARLVLGCSEPPPLEKKTVGKMGLAAYSSLLCGQVQGGRNGKFPAKSPRVSTSNSSSVHTSQTGLSPILSRSSLNDQDKKPNSIPRVNQHSLSKAGKSKLKLVLKPKTAARKTTEVLEKPKQLCKFYPNCTKGDACRFSHQA